MGYTYFNNIVKKLLKNNKKIIEINGIKKIIKNILDENFSENKSYKMIYYLKNKGYLLSLKKDIFYIKKPNENIDEESIKEKYYWKILKKHCKNNLNNDRYIGGLKALQLNINDFSIPEEIKIINPSKQSKEIVLNGKIISFKKYSTKGKDLFKKIKRNTIRTNINNNSFLISNLELSILESLYSPDITTSNYIDELVKKILRKHKKNINFENLNNLIMMGKHHTSINRLYKISKSIDEKLSKPISDIIKKYSFFLDI